MTRPYLIKEMTQLRVLTDPARWKILLALSKDPKTTKQVAEVLHEPPTRLYHHVKALERAGLVRLIRTRMKRGATEKYYRAVAENFIVDQRMFTSGKSKPPSIPGPYVGVMRDVLSAVSVDQDASAMQVLQETTGRPATWAQLRIRTTPTRVRALHRSLQAWLKKCREFDSPQGPDVYEVIVKFGPIGPRVATRRHGRRG